MHAWGEGAPQNSPVYKAVTPVEAATVDKVDTFFEVLFAGEESNMEGNAGVGRQVSQELPSPPLQSVRDRDPGSSVQLACRVKGNTAWEGSSTASSERGWPHHLGRRLSSRHEERAPTMGIFWPFRDVGMGRVRCHSLRPVTGGPGRIVSRGLEEGPQRARLRPESIPVLRYQC